MTDKQPRTLADMTPEEREQCRGMWADDSSAPRNQVIICEIITPNLIRCICPTQHEYVLGFPSEDITPRFDLPRAWNPDGTPVDADPEEYTTDGRSRVYLEGIEKVAFPPGTRVRRWVSDWEAVE